MTIKSVILILAAGVLAVCNGGAIPLGAPAPFAVQAGPFPAQVPVPLAKVGDYDPHPQYTYAYDVQDALTGDSKSQHESRDGDVVSGSYSLIEADGTRRVVEYTADPINGFNAVVHREPATFVKPVIKVGPPPLAYHV